MIGNITCHILKWKRQLEGRTGLVLSWTIFLVWTISLFEFVCKFCFGNILSLKFLLDIQIEISKMGSYMNVEFKEEFRAKDI